MHILVTGACGYKGSVLVPKLLAAGHQVTALDTQWFGNYLCEHTQLKIVRGDVRNPNDIPWAGLEAIIHLASIANDPCGDLDPKLTWEVSALATMQLLDMAKRQGIARFIYASSGSVYGVKTELEITEDVRLEPLSEYNKTKMVAERVALSYQDDMCIQIVRPATVCGLSPRMRLDVSVNMLTMQALGNRQITVFGGAQIRPNIHIDDITDLYLFLLERPQLSGIYNAGFENLSILEIAQKVQKYTDAQLAVTSSQDPRSYRMNSDKLLAAGFSPRKTVEHAIQDMLNAYQAGQLMDQPNWHNLHWMQQKVLV